MEKQITKKLAVEALEQIRAGFTVSRIALSAATIIYPLCKKDEKWGKKFTKIQNEYHKFLLSCYQDLEKVLPTLPEDNEDATE